MNACNATLMLQSNERSDPVSGLAFGGGGSLPLHLAARKHPVIISETRLMSAQQICRPLYSAPICRRDIWENCFVEATSCRDSELPRQPESPQADSMVLFGAFCNFCVQKRKKNLFQNDLNECIFVYVHGKDAIRRSVNSSGKDGGSELVCLVAFLCLILFLFFFIYIFFYYWAFYIIFNIFY